VSAWGRTAGETGEHREDREHRPVGQEVQGLRRAGGPMRKPPTVGCAAVPLIQEDPARSGGRRRRRRGSRRSATLRAAGSASRVDRLRSAAETNRVRGRRRRRTPGAVPSPVASRTGTGAAPARTAPPARASVAAAPTDATRRDLADPPFHAKERPEARCAAHTNAAPRPATKEPARSGGARRPQVTARTAGERGEGRRA
jgi:hypothetical protein